MNGVDGPCFIPAAEEPLILQCHFLKMVQKFEKEQKLPKESKKNWKKFYVNTNEDNHE